MNKTPRPRRPHEAGFTLIEIMVVLLIIGLIVSVVVPNLDFIWSDSQIRKAKIDLKMLHDIARQYKMTKGKLPEDLQVLTQKDDKGQALLVELPQDPWNNDYKMVIDSPTKWKIISFGPDGTEGGDDDISSVKEEN